MRRPKAVGVVASFDAECCGTVHDVGADGEFYCPVCRRTWQARAPMVSVLFVPVYASEEE